MGESDFIIVPCMRTMIKPEEQDIKWISLVCTVLFYLQYPYIDTLYPKYGPQAGGTQMVIKGAGFSSRQAYVTIDSQDCPVNSTIRYCFEIMCILSLRNAQFIIASDIFLPIDFQ